MNIRTAIFVEEQGFKDEFNEIDKTCSQRSRWNLF